MTFRGCIVKGQETTRCSFLQGRNTTYSMYKTNKLKISETNAQDNGHISTAAEPHKDDNFPRTQAGGNHEANFRHIIERLESIDANYAHQPRNDKKADMYGADVVTRKADFGDNSTGQITKPKEGEIR